MDSSTRNHGCDHGGDWWHYIGESVALSCGVKSGCQMSTMSTSRTESPSCQTSCSNESSNIINSPSIHSRVSLATLIRGPGGTTRPRWARIRQLVGPVCGQTWTTGCITENFIYRQPSKLIIIHGDGSCVSIAIICVCVSVCPHYKPKWLKLQSPNLPQG